MAETKRLFFALWPPASVTEALLAELPPGHIGRVTRPESIHLTLAFIGPAQPEPLLAIARTLVLPRFTLQLGSLRYWPHNRIVWAGLEDERQPGAPALLAFVGSLRQRLADVGAPQDGHRFTPHITLMRQAAPVAPRKIAPIAWHVTAWRLVESIPGTSGHYSPLAEWSAQ